MIIGFFVRIYVKLKKKKKRERCIEIYNGWLWMCKEIDD